jgi:hypothetical protein
MDTMSPLAKVEFDPDPDVVAAAEDLLERAKSGDIIAFGYAGLTQDRAITTRWSKPPTFRMTALIGAVSHLEYRMNKFQDE